MRNAGSVPIVLIVAHIFSMLGFSTYPALLPGLQAEWGMSNSQAGIVGSVLFAGYIATVSSWTALTDRMDGRWVYAAGSAVALALTHPLPIEALSFLVGWPDLDAAARLVALAG